MKSLYKVSIALAVAITQLFAQPTITSFTPTRGAIGTAVTINGANFSTTPSNNIVFFGATQATVTAASATQLTVKVPVGATYQPISVTVAGLTGYSSQPFIVTFPTVASITSGSFASKVDFATGSNPCGVAFGDIDGDGKPDLVVGSAYSNIVSVFRNTSSSGSITSGSFAAKVDFATGANPAGLAIGDVDGDGKPDLIIVNADNNTVSVFRNTSTSGSITFADPVNLTAGSNPFTVAIGDIDGDGKPDLVVANLHSSTVSVFRNTSSSGSVSFAAKVDFTTGSGPSSGPCSVAIGDIDGDGKPDLVVTNCVSNTVSVFRNTSSFGSITSSSFAAKVDFMTGVTPWGVAVGDIDGDGKPDLVVVNEASATISVFRNTSSSGSVSFAANVDFATGASPFSVAIGDNDGDGKPDLVVTNGRSSTVSVFRNTSSSGFITSGSFAAKVDFTTGEYPSGIAIGDIDGDGKPDLVVTNGASGTSVSVLQNLTQPPPPSITSFAPAFGPVGTIVTINGANFSSTPSNNIVFFGATQATVTAASTTQLTVRVPMGATYQPISVTVAGLTGYSSQPFIVTFPTVASITSGSFASKVDFATGANPYGVAFGDIDGDGKPDLVVGSAYSNTVSVFRNTSSSGSITSGSFAAKVDFATGANPCGLAIGDVDGDGKPDLVIVNSTSNSVSVFRNTSTSGSITFADRVDFTTGSNPRTVAIGDIDGDGEPDLVVTNLLGNTVSVFRNTSSSGSVSFAAKVHFTTGSGPWAVAIGDIDGDGKPDLVVTNNVSNTVSVFRNTSSSGSITSSSFAAKVDFTTGTTPVGAAIGDVDGDGKPDLVVVNQGSATVSVFRNTSSSGSVSFAPNVDFASGATPYSVAIGDIDGDGKPDLVVTNGASNTISVFRNTSSSGSITSTSFAAKVDFMTGAYPSGIAIGDIDGDGKPDLVVTNGASGNSISVLRNTLTSSSGLAVKLTNSTGARLTGGSLQYYDGSWKDAVNNNDGTFTVNTSLKMVSLRMTYAGGSQTRSNVSVGSDTVVFQTVNARVMLQNSGSTPIDMGIVQYYFAAWNDFGVTSSGIAAKELLPATYTFRMKYATASNDKQQDIGANPSVVFTTVNVTVQLKNSQGSFIDQGTVQYYFSSWQSLGVTANGVVTKELLPGSYTFRMTYASATNDKQQNIGMNATVVFQTVNAAIQLKNSQDNFIDQGTVQYYFSSWQSLGMTTNGVATKELLPASYTFRMTYAFAGNDKQQNIGANPTVIFQTVNTSVQLQNSQGALIDTGTVQYYSSSWQSFGTTSDGVAAKELLPANYTFRMSYASAIKDKQQNTGTNPTVVFNTVNATVQLKNSQGAFIDQGAVQYYFSSWKTLGSTTNGVASKELLPASYTFRMNYETVTNDRVQDISTNSTVSFSTVLCRVRVENSQGQPVDGALISYYYSSWRQTGTTTNGEVTKELLPANLTFRMSLGTTRQDKVQNIATNNFVLFTMQPGTQAAIQVMSPEEIMQTTSELMEPKEFALYQNYPNPFNPMTTIPFALPKGSQVSLKVFDLLGREVVTLVSQELEPGYFTVRWQADVPSGTYIYRLQAGSYVQTRKLILLK